MGEWGSGAGPAATFSIRTTSPHRPAAQKIYPMAKDDPSTSSPRANKSA
jgi:hypothetical protein